MKHTKRSTGSPTLEDYKRDARLRKALSQLTDKQLEAMELLIAVKLDHRLLEFAIRFFNMSPEDQADLHAMVMREIKKQAAASEKTRSGKLQVTRKDHSNES